jgi:Sap, sulfolipid-1-addressing protein
MQTLDVEKCDSAREVSAPRLTATRQPVGGAHRARQIAVWQGWTTGGRVGGAIGESIGYALAIAISPIPIAALILTLLSVNPRRASLAFTLGWVVGIGCVAVVGVVTPVLDPGDDPSDRRGWIRLTLGMILLLAAIRRWRNRPKPHEEPPTPPLMRAIDRSGAFGSLGIGFALATFNPKDTLLAVAGGAEIGSAGLAAGPTIVALLVFVGIAASTVIVPVGASMVAGERLDEPLRRSRELLIRHDAAVMAVVLVGVGVLFITEAIRILRG